MAKANFPKLTTPKGIAQYPWLTKPDTQYVAGGVFKVNLVLPVDEAQSVIDKIDAEIEKSYQAAKEKAKTPGEAKKIGKADPPYVMEEDAEGNETGRVIIKFKQNHTLKMKDGSIVKVKPNLFDASGKLIEGNVSVFGGSEIKVASEMVPYFNQKDKEAGVTLRLKAVQVIKLVSSNGADASAYGFGEEDGFSYDSNAGSDFDGGEYESDENEDF